MTVYLIKDGYTDPLSILKQYDASNSVRLDGIGTVTYGRSATYKPVWIKKFFRGRLDDIAEQLFNSTSKAVLITEPFTANNRQFVFAVCFGFGFSMIRKEVIEERFGLVVGLNSIKDSGLRKIDKKNLATAPRDTSEQLTRPGTVGDFGINIEQDLIQSVTGHLTDELSAILGRTVTGRDSVALSAPVNIGNLQSCLSTLADQYSSDAYKTKYPWVDYISEVRDLALNLDLNRRMLEKLKTRSLEKLWMAVPQLIEWERVSEFRFDQMSGQETALRDIDIESWFSTLQEEQISKLDVQTLRKSQVNAIAADNDQIIYHWPIYNCLYCELEGDLETDHSVYLLTNSKWYEVNRDFTASVNEQFRLLRDEQCDVQLPEFDTAACNSESDYNALVPSIVGTMALMDKRNISYGGGHSSVEFCDLFCTSKKLIHVKQYGNSSVLSHLFSQGLVSGQLFASQKDFRIKVREKLPESHKQLVLDERPPIQQYQVVYAIISKKDGPLEIPFFSKVALGVAKTTLEGTGYSVRLKKIQAT